MISQYLGFDSDYIIIGLAALVFILIILMIINVVQMSKLKKSYKIFMKGKNAKNLEDTLIKRLNQVDDLINANSANEKNIKTLFQNMQRTYQKMGLVKYDAFNEMGGKLSFSLAMLDVKNNGFIINAMHTREGCYTYIKEIIDGNSVIVLSGEEQEALNNAMGENNIAKQKDILYNKVRLVNDKTGLDKSSETFSDRINELAARFREINDEYFEELENILIMADVGVSMVMKIVSEIKTEVRIRNITDPREINDIIVDKMFVIYANESVMSTKINYSAEGLTVILMVGVNGAGKTTTIGKLAHRIVHDEGKKVVVAAGDTFRAGAIDQLAVWAERVGVDIVKGSFE